MSDFTKWLNLRGVSRSVEGNRKWDALRRAQVMEKLSVEFQMPAFTSSATRITTVSYITYQFNFTLSGNFTILNWQDIVNNLPTTMGYLRENFCLAIRYRVGDTVTRYRFNTMTDVVINEPFYSGQLIKANFVLEIWTPRILAEGEEPIVAFTSNPLPVNFLTSIQFDPTSPSDTNLVVAPDSIASGSPTFDLGTLFLELNPSADLPLTFPVNGPFNSN